MITLACARGIAADIICTRPTRAQNLPPTCFEDVAAAALVAFAIGHGIAAEFIGTLPASAHRVTGLGCPAACVTCMGSDACGIHGNAAVVISASVAVTAALNPASIRLSAALGTGVIRTCGHWTSSASATSLTWCFPVCASF